MNKKNNKSNSANRKKQLLNYIKTLKESTKLSKKNPEKPYVVQYEDTVVILLAGQPTGSIDACPSLSDSERKHLGNMFLLVFSEIQKNQKIEIGFFSSYAGLMECYEKMKSNEEPKSEKE